MPRKFKKLDIDLPRQPMSDQQVWQIAGLLFALLFLVFTLYSYLDYRSDGKAFKETGVTNFQTS